MTKPNAELVAEICDCLSIMQHKYMKLLGHLLTSKDPKEVDKALDDIMSDILVFVVDCPIQTKIYVIDELTGTLITRDQYTLWKKIHDEPKKRKMKRIMKRLEHFRRIKAHKQLVTALRLLDIKVADPNWMDDAKNFKNALCVICKKDEPKFSWLPCRHLALCGDCHKKPQVLALGICPMCKVDIFCWKIIKV